MKLFNFKNIFFFLFLLSFHFGFSQNVKVEPTFTYLNSATKIYTVSDLKVISLPTGATPFWYDALTGGNIVLPTTPLISGKKYFLETIPTAAIGSRLQTIVYQITPTITADKTSNICTGETVKLSGNNLLSSEQFSTENTNGLGLKLTKVTQIGNSTYYVKKETMSWENANNLINAIPGASMYIINSTTEETAVYNALTSLGLTNGTIGDDGIAFWLGLKQYGNASNFSDSAVQGGWYWIDGTPMTYANWSDGEPNDYRDAPGNSPPFQLYEIGGSNDEDYAQFEFQNRGIKWNDAPNDTPNRNSYPIFEFTATSSLQWFQLNTVTNNYDPISGATAGELTVTATAGIQKYRLNLLLNGTTYSIFYEVLKTQPQIYSIPTSLTTICDDETNPLNQDGKANFDTSTFDATLIGSQTGMVIKYFSQSGATLSSPLPNPFGSLTQNITARIEQTSNPACFTSAIIPLIVKPLPRIKTNNGGSEDIQICSNSTVFSTTLDAGINDGTPTTDYTYIWSKGSTVITGETNATLNATSAGSYSVQVTSKTTNCSSIRNIIITIGVPPQINPIPANLTSTCDDETDPILQDGKASFDTSTFEATLLGSQTGMTIKYTDQAGASLTSPLPNPFITNTQNITVRIERNSNASCFVTTTFPLIVKPLPKIKTNSNGSEDIYICSNSTVITSTLDAGINDGSPTTDYTYIWSKGGTVISGETNATLNASSAGNYSVQVTSKTTNCIATRTIKIIVTSIPQVFPINPSLTTACDDDISPLTQDGQFPFNTATFESTILGGQIGMTIKYLAQNGDVIPTPLPTSFLTTTQNITVRVENTINPSCFSTGSIQFTVKPLPKINTNANGNEDVLICSDNPGFLVQLDAAIQDGTPDSDYDFIWSKDGTIINGETSSVLNNVNIEGNYTVEVISKATKCSSTRTLKVIPSKAPTIASINIIDLSPTNSATIILTDNLGKYEYSLNGSSGPFQDKNTFNNIESGIYNVYVKDINNCGFDAKTIYVIGAPQFFTPNGDGFNDYWNIKGIDNTFNTNSIIYIYDRYGKFIKQLKPLDQGWDGTYTGRQLPTSDYWYTVKLEDGREAKGHFSLKR
ncbi:T9SS type B sorting domain-containing protein [Flavobacterium ovatum]|uniref:T9SS type B sorting domain-containing protein n=1 Tax=Flavobacterium ovatum TaxID=1928857 RepID=UPI00344BC81F